MKRLTFAFMLSLMVTTAVQAQVDDLYFTPKKAKPATPSTNTDVATSSSTHFRDVDEYNRRGKYWSHYQKIATDANGNDIIEFQQGAGVYPDSTYVDTTFVVKQLAAADIGDYYYSRQLSRFDGYYAPWSYYSFWYGPNYGWYDPWYGPYYSHWYNPWYYTAWYGAYAPYWGYPYGYYPYYGWGYYPHWGHPRPTSYTSNSWGGGHNGKPTYRNGQFGGRSTQSSSRTTPYKHSTTQSRPVFGGNSGSYQRTSPSSGSFGGRSGGGSFGGGSSRSGSFGGGGHFGGRR